MRYIAAEDFTQQAKRYRRGQVIPDGAFDERRLRELARLGRIEPVPHWSDVANPEPTDDTPSDEPVLTLTFPDDDNGEDGDDGDEHDGNEHEQDTGLPADDTEEQAPEPFSGRY